MEIEMFITYSGLDKFVFFDCIELNTTYCKAADSEIQARKKVICFFIFTITQSRGRIPFFLSSCFASVVQALKN